METHMIFETHAHYDDEAFEQDREALLNSMEAHGIGHIVNACASFLIPQSSTNSASSTGCFCVPFFSLIQTAITLPIIKFSYITIDQSWTGHLYFSILLFSCTITGFARKDLYSMSQCINDIFQTFPHCLWTSRQIDD